jgi:DNA uptake protein ComE-like DNA-binding protein
MKKAIKDFFTFDKRGFNGVVVLIVILCLQLITLWLLNFYQPLSKVNPQPVLVNPALLDSLEYHSKRKYESKVQETFDEDVVKRHYSDKQKKRFVFNPNSVSQQQWEELGLSKNQAKSVRKYIERGGKFMKPEDVLKIKVVKPELWNELIPYIVISQTSKPVEIAQKDTADTKKIDKEKERLRLLEERKRTLVFDINTCNRYNFQMLDLLDSLSIEKIMRYKKALGGFVSLNQLYEIDQIDTTNFTQLKSHLLLDLMSLRTININTCSASQLSKHPYVTYNTAVALVNYRITHGKYAQLSDLKKCVAANDALLKKLGPYLRFNDD